MTLDGCKALCDKGDYGEGACATANAVGGPWFHDGRYPDLKTLLASSNGKMAHTAQLSPEDTAALEAFLSSL
jgi:hypothetical protein